MPKCFAYPLKRTGVVMFKPIGNGNGNGNGYGYGDGDGYGNGNGSGYGYGYGNGNGTVNTLKPLNKNEQK